MENKKSIKVRIIIYAVILLLLLVPFVGYKIYVKYQISQESLPQEQTAIDVFPKAWPKDVERADISRFSAPSDPWSILSEPCTTILAFYPVTTENGVITDVGKALCRAIATHWYLDSPPGIGVSDLREFQPSFESMLPYPDDGATYRMEPAIVSRHAAFYGATHYLAGTYREEGEQIIYKAVLYAKHSPDMDEIEAKEKEFRVDANKKLLLAAQVASWMIEAAELRIPDDYKQKLGKPQLGDEILDFSSPLFEEMLNDWKHPNWEEQIKRYPEATNLQFLRASYAQVNKSLEGCRELDPGPLPADAPYWQRATRLACLYGIRNYPAAIHEGEIMVAMRPGNVYHWDRCYHYLMPDDLKKSEFVASVEQSSKRLPDSPIFDTLIGRAHLRAAWQYRGTEWAKDVPRENMHMYMDLQRSGQQYFDKALDAAGTIPWIAAEYTSALGATGFDERMLKLHNQVMKEYPDYSGTWLQVLNFTRPRWGGSNRQAMKMIDSIHESDSKNPWLYMNAFTYHHMEMWLYKDSFKGDWNTYFDQYCTMYPSVNDQMLASIKKLRQCEPKNAASAAALGIAHCMREGDLMDEIFNENPASYFDYFNYAPDDYRGETMLMNGYYLFERGMKPELLDHVEKCLKHDANARKKQLKASECVFQTDQDQDLLHGIALMVNGQVEHGYEMTLPYMHDVPWSHGALVTQLYVEKIGEKTMPTIDALIALDPDEKHYKILKCYVLIKQGNIEEAKRLYDENKDAKMRIPFYSSEILQRIKFE